VSGEALLRVEGLSLRFGGVAALTGVDFEVREDELFAVIGPNGAGKTSIFNCLNAVHRPQEGSIRFDGVELSRARPARVARLGIARTFQNLALFDNLDVVDNLMLGRHLRMSTGFVAGACWLGRARREEIDNRQRVEEIVDLLELGPYRGTPVGVLPYGVRKRVELGRAVAMDPRLLLLDEPAAGMSLEETEDMARAILELRRRGITMLLVEHDMHLVMDLADRILALEFGRPIAIGTPAAVQADPRVVAAYLGANA
jgi:branched-chain amino acid transport system ATP-binding protein